MRASIAWVVLVAAACPDREVSQVTPAQQKQERKDVPVEVNRDIDILFVIDNSGSMGEEQASLAANFVNFINVLEGTEGGLPNVHIGVVSSNVGAGGQPISACTGDGDNGRLQNTPRAVGCSPPSQPFIRDVDDGAGGRIRNYTGALEDTFSCIAELGVNGCGFEQHFEAMRRALDGRNPENDGFLRENAHLAVIFIADEDDCSATSGAVFDPAQTSISDPLGPRTSFRCAEFGYLCDGAAIGRSPAVLDPPGGALECEPQGQRGMGPTQHLFHPDVYVDFLRGLKPVDPNLIIVAGIVGNPDPVAIQLDEDGNPEIAPSCVSSSGEADPGIRFKYFMDRFPNRNTFTSICNTDLSDALTQVAELLARVIGNPCLEGLIDPSDVRADMAGTQYDCQVSDVRYPGTDLEEQAVIPRCVQSSDSAIDPASPTPCWWLRPDTAGCGMVPPVGCCDTPTGLALLVERGDSDPLPGTHVVASCVTN